MSYQDLGYNPLLNKVDIGTNINESNTNEILGDISIGYNQIDFKSFEPNQDLQSKDFETGVSGWRIQGIGDVEFNDGIFRGTLEAGSIHIPDEDTTANSFHVESDGDSFWGCTQSDFIANNNNANAYVLKTGVAKFQSVTIDGGSNVIFISNTLDTSAKTVLQDFTFSPSDYSGAFKTGSITWNSSTGVVTGGTGMVINKNGIVGASGGSETFSILTDGSASFSGEITASTITGGTITGATVRTASSGERVQMSGSDLFFYSDVGNFPSLAFREDGVSLKGWDILFVNSSGGGWTAGDLNIVPESSNASDRVRFGQTLTTCNVTIHGSLSINTFSGDLIPTGASQDMGDGSNYWGDIYCDGMSMTGNLVTQENIQPIPTFTGSVGTSSYTFESMYATTFYFAASGKTTRYIQMGSNGTIDCNGALFTTRLQLAVGTNLYGLP